MISNNIFQGLITNRVDLADTLGTGKGSELGSQL